MNKEWMQPNENNESIDNYLNFNEQFTIDSINVDGINKTSAQRKIEAMVIKGGYFWFRIMNNQGNIQLTPIYNDLDINLLQWKKLRDYNSDENLRKKWFELAEGNLFYVRFSKSNNISDQVEKIEDEITNVLK